MTSDIPSYHIYRMKLNNMTNIPIKFGVARPSTQENIKFFLPGPLMIKRLEK